MTPEVVPGETGGRKVLTGWSRQASLLVALVVGGVVLALVWRALTPAAGKLGDEQEASAAVDSTLAVLGLVAGALTSAFVLLRPGPDPGRRALVAIVGSIVAGAVSWQLGDLLGTPALRAVGAAFTWPVATSVGLFVGAMLPWTSGRLNGPEVDEYGGDYGAAFSGPARSGPSGPE